MTESKYCPKFCKCLTYDIVCRIVRIGQVICAVLITILAILRFVNYKKINSTANVIMTIYFFFFAFIIIMTEFGILLSKKVFYFLNFGWGKCIFYIFIGSMALSGKVDRSFDIPIGVILWVCAFFVLTVTLFYRE